MEPMFSIYQDFPIPFMSGFHMFSKLSLIEWTLNNWDFHMTLLIKLPSVCKSNLFQLISVNQQNTQSAEVPTKHLMVNNGQKSCTKIKICFIFHDFQ